MWLFSLKRRIGICTASMMILVIIIISVIAYREFQEALIGSLDLKLQSDMNTVKYLLQKKSTFSMETQKEVLAFLHPQKETQGVGYQIWFENGNISTNDLVSMDIYNNLVQQKIATPELNDYRIISMTEEQTTYRAIWARYPVPNHLNNQTGILNIALATSSTYAYHEIGEFMQALFILGGIILWISLGLIQGTLKWGLRPVDILAQRMSGISGSNLATFNHHHNDRNIPKELIPFVTAWQKMLKKLAHAMAEQKRFTSDAAHELRTPIALIKSTLQLAQSQKRSVSYYEETISQALEDIERLNALTEQLLQLSRLENENAQVDREIINIEDLIRDIVEQYRSLVQEKGFEFTLRLRPENISGNSHQIRQLLLNLIDNAVSYAPRETMITLSMDTANTTVAITVHDEGGSIPQDECAHIFDRFYRVSKARGRNSGGSGLGLAIAKEIALLHAGNITVTSTPQDGTSFVVTLPIHREYC